MRRFAMSALAAAAATVSLAGSFGYGPAHTRPSGYRTINRLNRSRRWPRARTYAEARAISPYPERVVR